MQKDYNHFNMFFNRKMRKKGFYDNIAYKKDMTYILGARCTDGVVLVGDTKVTVGDGTDYTYEKKITPLLDNVVIASAGIGGLSRDFQNRVISAVVRMEKDRIEEGRDKDFPQITTEQEFSVLVSKVLRDMHTDYGEDSYLIKTNLTILCGSRIGSQYAQLTTFTGYGFPEPVNEIRAIGHGEPYGSIFIKKMWKPSMNMEQATKLGLFIIKFIDDMKLDFSVGFNTECLPQVVLIPDIQIPQEILIGEPISTYDDWVERQEATRPYLEKYPIVQLQDEITKQYMNEISSRISEFNSLFIKGHFKI